MTTERGAPPADGRRLHHIRNHLSIIIGYCDLLLRELPDSDRKHADILEIRKAATAAAALLEGPSDLLR